MAVHKPGYIVIVVLAFLAFCFTMVISYLNNNASFRKMFPNVFHSSIGNLSDKYHLDITPAGWTFSIWGFIYLYQVIWLIYGLSTLCRKTSDWQGYLYYHPAYMPLAIYLIYILTCGLTTAWLFTWDREWLIPSCAILFGCPLTLWLCIGLSYRALNRTSSELIRKGHGLEIRLVRGLVQNGLGMFASWSSIASLLNLGIVLVYVVGLTMTDTGSMILGILGVLIVLYFLIDVLVTERSSRYTFTPYIVLVVALVGSMMGNWNPWGRNFIITVVLLGLSSVLFLIKIIYTIVQSRKDQQPIQEAKVKILD